MHLTECFKNLSKGHSIWISDLKLHLLFWGIKWIENIRGVHMCIILPIRLSNPYRRRVSWSLVWTRDNTQSWYSISIHCSDSIRADQSRVSFCSILKGDMTLRQSESGRVCHSATRVARAQCLPSLSLRCEYKNELEQQESITIYRYLLSKSMFLFLKKSVSDQRFYIYFAISE